MFKLVPSKDEMTPTKLICDADLNKIILGVKHVEKKRVYILLTTANVDDEPYYVFVKMCGTATKLLSAFTVDEILQKADDNNYTIYEFETELEMASFIVSNETTEEKICQDTSDAGVEQSIAKESVQYVPSKDH